MSQVPITRLLANQVADAPTFVGKGMSGLLLAVRTQSHFSEVWLWDRSGIVVVETTTLVVDASRFGVAACAALCFVRAQMTFVGPTAAMASAAATTTRIICSGVVTLKPVKQIEAEELYCTHVLTLPPATQDSKTGALVGRVVRGSGSGRFTLHTLAGSFAVHLHEGAPAPADSDRAVLFNVTVTKPVLGARGRSFVAKEGAASPKFFVSIGSNSLVVPLSSVPEQYRIGIFANTDEFPICPRIDYGNVHSVILKKLRERAPGDIVTLIGNYMVMKVELTPEHQLQKMKLLPVESEENVYVDLAIFDTNNHVKVERGSVVTVENVSVNVFNHAHNLKFISISVVTVVEGARGRSFSPTPPTPHNPTTPRTEVSKEEALEEEIPSARKRSRS